MPTAQTALFDTPPALPDGFVYRPELITPGEERALVARFADLPFKPFEFRGYLGKRRTASFGWRYDYNAQRLHEADPVPDWLLPLRGRAEAFAGVELHQTLITEYEAGAEIGWHRDRPHFAEVVGVSFLAPAPFRFRRRLGAGWERLTQTVAPRSAYIMTGPAREDWEHSIPALPELRYSATFRRLRPRRP